MSESGSEDSLRLTLSPPRTLSQLDRSESSYPGQSDAQQRASSSGEDRIAPPFPWSTDRRAVVQPLSFLVSNGLTTIEGQVKCKRCNALQTLEVDLDLAFDRVSGYFLSHKHSMHDRAPRMWSVPRLLDCRMCNQSECAKPVIDGKKRSINWLFLLLTQTIGVCKLEQLKYFCKHTRKHRTGAKDRVLYLTYAGLLKQLDPAGPYD